jgi:hypothetical protein
MVLADTDPSTPAPDLVERTAFTRSLTLNLESGQKFNGGAFVNLQVTSQGILDVPSLISTIDRQAAASSDVTLTSIHFTS